MPDIQSFVILLCRLVVGNRTILRIDYRTLIPIRLSILIIMLNLYHIPMLRSYDPLLILNQWPLIQFHYFIGSTCNKEQNGTLRSAGVHNKTLLWEGSGKELASCSMKQRMESKTRQRNNNTRPISRLKYYFTKSILKFARISLWLTSCQYFSSFYLFQALHSPTHAHPYSIGNTSTGIQCKYTISVCWLICWVYSRIAIITFFGCNWFTLKLSSTCYAHEDKSPTATPATIIADVDRIVSPLDFIISDRYGDEQSFFMEHSFYWFLLHC